MNKNSRSAINKKRSNKSNKYQQRNMKSKLIIISMFVLFISFLSINRLSTKATTVPGNNYGELKYESVALEYGDTFWDLAMSHTDGSKKQVEYCIKEIRRINHMSRFETLKAGEYVIVPCLNVK